MIKSSAPTGPFVPVLSCSSPANQLTFAYVLMLTDQMVRIGIVSVIPAVLLSNGNKEVEREAILDNQRLLIEIPIKMLTDSEQEVIYRL